MTSILAAVREAWSQSAVLNGLIPAVRITLGPPNPGSSLPRLGLITSTQISGLRTSEGKYPGVLITALAEAESAELLEEIADAMHVHLEHWQSPRFVSIRQVSLQASIQRDEDGPSTLWRADFTIQYQAARQT